MSISESEAVDEAIASEEREGLYVVMYLLGKKSNKYGTVWRDSEHALIVWARNSEHARRLVLTSVRKNVNSFETKIQVSVRAANPISL